MKYSEISIKHFLLSAAKNIFKISQGISPYSVQTRENADQNNSNMDTLHAVIVVGLSCSWKISWSTWCIKTSIRHYVIKKMEVIWRHSPRYSLMYSSLCSLMYSPGTFTERFSERYRQTIPEMIFNAFPMVRGRSRTAETSMMERFVIIVKRLEAVNYYHKALHLGCCSSPRAASDGIPWGNSRIFFDLIPDTYPMAFSSALPNAFF